MTVLILCDCISSYDKTAIEIESEFFVGAEWTQLKEIGHKTSISDCLHFVFLSNMVNLLNLLKCCASPSEIIKTISILTYIMG